MKRLREWIPSMFHRRLLLLLVGMSCAATVLGAQLAHLTAVEGRRLREEAEKVLSTRKLIGTERGRIYDRKGRVLAEDRPCFDIAVGYAVISDQWAYDEARRAAYRANRRQWAKLSFEQREALVERYRPEFDERAERLWRTMARLGGVDRAELERRKATVIERVQQIRSEVWDRRAKRRAMEVEGPVELSEVAIPVLEEREAHTLLAAVSDEVAHEFMKLQGVLPGVEVVRSKTRAQPLSEMEVELDRAALPTPLRRDRPMRLRVASLGGHVVGSMREVWAEDVARRPFDAGGGDVDLGGYLPGDVTGQGGVEEAMEQRLRGLRGQRVERRDTKQEVRRPPRGGEDVYLTIDMALQARIRALMDPRFGLMRVQPWHENERMSIDTPLYGAAVVMEVSSGEVLALVSTPMPPPREEGQPYPDLGIHPDRPLINKPVWGVYPPGSTLKPIVYCIAAGSGAIGPDEVIECTGHLLEDRDDVFRCWVYRERYGLIGHGPLGPVEAIARSCNIYFYTCGRRLGAERLLSEMGRWGFGRRTGLALGSEVDGLLPRLEGRNPPGRAPSVSNATMMGIGQGPIAVPPIQVTAAHAALARGGRYIAPLLVRELGDRQARRDLGVPADVARRALRGMHDSANHEGYGAAHALPIGSQREPILNLEGVVVRAKTGTAQASPQYNLVRTEEGRVVRGDRLLRSGDHSWYVCHVQRRGEARAAYVVAVIVEYGGSGGRVSGPVANQVLHALRAEGYL